VTAVSGRRRREAENEQRNQLVTGRVAIGLAILIAAALLVTYFVTRDSDDESPELLGTGGELSVIGIVLLIGGIGSVLRGLFWNAVDSRLSRRFKSYDGGWAGSWWIPFGLTTATIGVVVAVVGQAIG
jgi:hypothetical protein